MASFKGIKLLCAHRPLLVLLLAQLWLAKIGMCVEESDNGGGDNNGGAEGGFCKEFAHLSLCQLRQHLLQVDQLLDMAIGEIDYLAGGGAAAISAPSNMAAEDSPVEKRGGARSLAGAPLLVRLASRGGGGTTGAGRMGAGKIHAAGAGILLGTGGPLRQSPLGGPSRPSTTYRLIRLPLGATGRPVANGGAGRQQQQQLASSRTALGGGQQGNQLLRQLWA